jgi:hypothetical protein
MTLYSAIAELVHGYCDAVTRRDLDQWASCWAPEGRWEMRADRVATDPESRIAILRRAFDVLDGVVQMASNGSVTATGADTAAGRWYIVEHTRRTTGERGLLLAHYDDRYVRIDGRWLFAARTLVRHYEGPPDLTGLFSGPAGAAC